MKAHRKTVESSTGGTLNRKIAVHRSARLAPSRRSDGEWERRDTSSGASVSRHVIGSVTERPAMSRTSRTAGRGLAVVGQLDSKNRLSLPRSVRDAIDVGPGDSVFLNVDDGAEGVPTVRVVKAINPLAMMLDALAEDAIRQYHAGETIGFDELMEELESDGEVERRPDAV